MRPWLVLAIIVAASCAQFVRAQQGSDVPGSTPPAPKQKSDGLEMRKVISTLSGKWSYTETAVAREGASSGATTGGDEVWQTATGGLTLTEENHTKSSDGDFYDSAVIWWDGKAQEIRGIWCSDINDEGCNGFVVHWDGDDIVMVGEWEQAGQPHAWKEVFAPKGQNAFTQTLYFGPPGGTMERASEIQATRISAHTHGR